MKIVFLAMVIFGEAAFSPLLANMPLIDEIAARDKAADDTVAAIRTPQELKAKQAAWRTWWLDALETEVGRIVGRMGVDLVLDGLARLPHLAHELTRPCPMAKALCGRVRPHAFSKLYLKLFWLFSI